MALSTGGECRIDELARMAGTTVRNVRAYQDRGILPRPRRAGRVALYGELHLSRLRLIAALLERGYTLANIAELVAAWERGDDVADVLGLDAVLAGPWAGPVPVSVSDEEVVSAFGDQAPRLIAAGVEVGLLVEGGHGSYRVTNPPALETTRVLFAAGVPLDAIFAVARRLREVVAAVASAFAGLVEDHVVRPLGEPLPAAELGRLGGLVEQVRPLVEQLVATELDRAVEEEIRRRLGEHLERLASRPPGERRNTPPRSKR